MTESEAYHSHFIQREKEKNTTIPMNSVVMCGAEEKIMNRSEDNLKNPAM